MGVRNYFLKKRKLCLQNLTKESKQPSVVIPQQAIFCNTFILCLQIRMIRRSNQGVQLMNFFSQILFNNIGYKAALLKKNSCSCFQFIWMWLLISVMKSGTERMHAPYSTALMCESFSEKSLKKEDLCCHDKTHYYFQKSNIPVINLIVDSGNMIKVSKNMRL